MEPSHKYILAIDQGTTGSTCLVVKLADSSLEVISQHTEDFKQYYPKPGWVEHDLEEIWTSVETAGQRAVALASKKDADFSAEKISSVGITNQRETLCAWQKNSGKPLCNAIVWQCRRSADICARIRKSADATYVVEQTGLKLDPYFSGSKISWLLENNSTVKSELENDNLCFGTIDSFLLYRLTQGKKFLTEPSNASRTLLYNIHTGEYDSKLLRTFGLNDSKCLAKVVDSHALFGECRGISFIKDGTPIQGILGDQQAALLGCGATHVGDIKCTYGTGAFALIQTGENIVTSKNQLLSTVAWQIEGKRSFAVEGSCYIAGAAVQFIRDQLKFIETAKDTAEKASKEWASPELIFVPALSGIAAPYWNSDVRGAFLGMSRGTNQTELIRATLEGIAFQVNDLIECFREDFGSDIQKMFVDGGASANDLLMQIQAELTELELKRPKYMETTALGAALMAAFGAGIIQNFTEVSRLNSVDKSYHSSKEQTHALRIRAWKQAVKAIHCFADITPK